MHWFYRDLLVRKDMRLLLLFAVAASSFAQIPIPGAGGGSGGGGTGTITNIATGCGITGGPVTTTGTVSGSVPVTAHNTGYAIVTGDCGSALTSNVAAAYTLAQAGSAGFPAGWHVIVENVGASGNVTVTATTSVFYGNGTSLSVATLLPGTSVDLISDGTNWLVASYTQGPVSAGAPSFPLNAQTATYQVLASDFASCKLISVASGTFTATLVASGAQPANGQCIWVVNYGSGVVTVARSGQNINGAAANLTLGAGSASAPTAAFITSDGTNYFATTLGNATTAAPLSQFSTTTSAQLAGVISDETGTGSAVFGTSPTLVTPILGTITSGVGTALTALASGNMNYTAPGTGAVSVTQTVQNNAIVNAQNFGAKCDGSTNDATAIQAALTAAGLVGGGGGAVLLPTFGCTGAYVTGSTTLTIPPHTILEGQGRSATSIKYTGTGVAISVGVSGTKTFYHVVRDLNIDLKSAGTGATGILMTQTFDDAYTNLDIQTSITASNTGQTAIQLDGGNDFGTAVQFDNISASGCFLYGVHYTGSSATVSYTIANMKGFFFSQSCASGTGMTAGLSITSCTAANPSVCTATGAAAAFPVNSLVKISGVTGTIAAQVNGYWNVLASTTNTITLEGTFGSGLVYTSGGTIQLATVGWWGWNGDQTVAAAADFEGWEVGAAVNRTGANTHQLRLEGNTVDWLVTGNADGAVMNGTFNPAATVDRGSATNQTSVSPGLEESVITTLTAANGLKVSGGNNTGANNYLCLSLFPTSACDTFWNRNFGGSSSIQAGAGNTTVFNVEAQSGNATFSLQNSSAVAQVSLSSASPSISLYNGVATVAGGVPAIYGQSNLVTQGAAISAAALVTPSTTGFYRVSYTAKPTQNPTTSAVLGGTTGFVLAYTDGTDSVAQTLTLTASNQSGAIVTIGTGNTCTTTGCATTISYGSAVIFAKTGVAMTYSYGYSSVGGTPMQFEIHVRVEGL